MPYIILIVLITIIIIITITNEWTFTVAATTKQSRKPPRAWFPVLSVMRTVHAARRVHVFWDGLLQSRKQLSSTCRRKFCRCGEKVHYSKQTVEINSILTLGFTRSASDSCLFWIFARLLFILLALRESEWVAMEAAAMASDADVPSSCVIRTFKLDILLQRMCNACFVRLDGIAIKTEAASFKNVGRRCF